MMLADAGRLSAQMQSAKEFSKKSTTKGVSSSRNNRSTASSVNINSNSIISDYSHRSNHSHRSNNGGGGASTTLSSPTLRGGKKRANNNNNNNSKIISSDFEVLRHKKGCLLVPFNDEKHADDDDDFRCSSKKNEKSSSMIRKSSIISDHSYGSNGGGITSGASAHHNSPTRKVTAFGMNKSSKFPPDFDEVASKSLRQKGSLLISFHEEDDNNKERSSQPQDADDDIEFGNVNVNNSIITQKGGQQRRDYGGGGDYYHNNDKNTGTGFVHHDDGNSSVFSLGNYSSSDGGRAYASATSPNRIELITILVMFVGAIGASIFIGYGIKHATLEQQSTFTLHTEEVALELGLTLEDYERAGKWLHQACYTPTKPIISRQEFHQIYQYMSTSIDFQSIQWMPKVYDDERIQLENESKAYFTKHYPYLNYTGITGFVPIDPNATEPPEWSFPGYTFQRQRSKQPFYYPIHYIEPILNNTRMIELDAYSWPTERDAIDQTIETWEPVVSNSLKLLQQISDDPNEHRIRFLHPGIPLEASIGENDEEEPHVVNNTMAQDIAVIVVPVKSILERGIKYLGEDMTIYLYDSSSSRNSDEYHFIIGAELYHSTTNDEPSKFVFLPEVDYQTLIEDGGPLMQSYEISVTPTSTWTAVFVPLNSSASEDESLTIILAGVFIFIAGVVIALWLRRDIIRIRTLQDTRRQSEAERAALSVKSAKQAAKMEQELNDYIAHEVRNPLAAAMSACSFVKSAVEDDTHDPFILSQEDVTSVREDVAIIDTSLAFMNDLLRSMLDMHKAATKKMRLDVGPVDIMNDIIQPVSAMLYQRSSTFEVITECDDNLFVFSDKLRLKQVMLNLARNSSKFVEQGYILLGAHVENGTVRIVVEDTGPGISKQKQKRLFSKFQESLDLTNQGTGMGLCLCKNIVDLLGGEIWLDTSYKSDIEGNPGSRFVIDLKIPPMTDDQYMAVINPGGATSAAIDEEKQSLLQGGSSGNSVTSSTATSVSLQPVEEQQELGDTQMIRQQQGSNNPPQSSNLVPFADNIQGTKQEKDPTTGSSTETTDITVPMVSTHIEKTEKDPEEDENSLPEKMSVLFVDDDLILRKLFARSIKKAVTGWVVKEAANGETALRMVDTESFDLIFMDQYMASFEKQLLGTEATRALRVKGVTSLICGLSANDVAEGFIRAGADAFLFKPFPCKPDELRKELARIIKGNGKKTRFLHNDSV